MIVLLLCSFDIRAQVNEQDSLSLIAFYNSMDGPNWSDNTGWLNGPVNTWHGITIDSNEVTKIDLQNNNLIGTFPTEVTQLSTLKLLNIALNSIQGELPESIGNLINLEELVISKNELSGTVPASLNQLDSLKRLVLLSNNFTGMVPDLSNLKLLEEIVIGSNDFSGPFPESLLELPNLKFISLTRMNLVGEVPSDIFEKLTILEQIKLCDNQLEGDRKSVV